MKLIIRDDLNHKDLHFNFKILPRFAITASLELINNINILPRDKRNIDGTHLRSKGKHSRNINKKLSRINHCIFGT